MDKDAPILNALVVEAARVIVGDPKVAAQTWDKYALVAWYGEGVSTLNGFRYVGEEPGQPATPGAADLEDRIDALRAATRFRSEGHPSEIQSLLRTPYDAFCLKKKK